jgi:hypothetical protein
MSWRRGHGVLALMGSGETSPTMVTVHRELVARLGEAPTAVLLETPYGFQENATDISARARRYFASSVGLQVTVPPGLRTPLADPRGAQTALASVLGADWLFSGPGSPSYALTQWRASPVAAALRERVSASRGVTVFASAALCAVGRLAVPVYEIYKAGAEPHWLDGLDLLAELELDVVAIPHYDNAEGGTHDTRYAYLGERRLKAMERDLPADLAVLGVDEHTAVLIDPAADTVEVRGRGRLTVRRAGVSTVIPSGEVLTLTELRELAKGARRPPAAASEDGQPVAPEAGVREDGAPGDGTSDPGSAQGGAASLRDAVAACERRFDAAVDARDAPALVQCILDVDTAITAWSADMEEEDDPETARMVQRGLVVRLGEFAGLGIRDPRAELAPMVDALISVRAELRRQRHWLLADALRDALRAGGVELRDTRDGTRWELRDDGSRQRAGQQHPAEQAGEVADLVDGEAADGLLGEAGTAGRAHQPYNGPAPVDHGMAEDRDRDERRGR